MTTTQPTLRDLLTIRDYLRDRRDELHKRGFYRDAQALGEEVVRIGREIAKAEAEAEA